LENYSIFEKILDARHLIPEVSEKEFAFLTRLCLQPIKIAFDLVANTQENLLLWIGRFREKVLLWEVWKFPVDGIGEGF
jgi:hypothetical protein